METPLQLDIDNDFDFNISVTILILVETPLQHNTLEKINKNYNSHNPYFSGNSFATALGFYSFYFPIASQPLF